MNNQQLENLILGYFDGQLTSQQESELAQRLDESPAARELFASYMRLEGATIDLGIADAIKSCPNESTSCVEVQRQPRQSSSSWRSSSNASFAWVSGIAITLAVGYLLVFFRPSSNVSKPLVSVARIVRLVDVHWQGEEGFDIGNELKPGVYNIASGLAEIEFNNGASLIVEGPSTFDITSAERAFLRHGRIRSIVPPQAFGFTIESENMKVIDLGTEFGMEVDTDGNSEVHVFDGEVEVYETHPTTIMANRLLSAGQAIQVERVGMQRDIPADIDAFVDPLSLDERASSFVEQMETRIKQIQSEQRQVARKIRERQRAVKQSKRFKQLKTKAAKSWSQFESTMQQAPKYQKLKKQKDQAVSHADKLVHDLLSELPQGESLLKKLADTNEELASLKHQLSQDRKRRGPRTKLVREIKKTQKRRRQLQKQFRQQRIEIEKSHPEVKEAVSKLKVARKQLAKHVVKSPLGKLKKTAEKNRKQFLSEQNRLLSNDLRLVELRAKMSALTGDAQRVRRRIRQARKWPTTKFVRDAELSQHEMEL